MQNFRETDINSYCPLGIVKTHNSEAVHHRDPMNAIAWDTSDLFS